MASVASITPSLNGTGNGGVKQPKVKSKNQLRRLKQKQKKLTGSTTTDNGDTTNGESVKHEQDEEMPLTSSNNNNTNTNKDMDYSMDIVVDFKVAGFEQFADVFAKYQMPSEDTSTTKNETSTKGEIIYSDDDMESASENSDDSSSSPNKSKPLSKKKQRKLNRLTVAELKQLVKKPEVVEWTDVTASDPRLLLHLKSYRNTVPIPGHWSAKRDYLQGKRGIEKPPFQLPAYIADTGIAVMRDAVKEKEAGMSLKQKTRERVQPKMGKVDIDYQKLHDAFFKFQTKPVVTTFGEMYYEGKEFETSLKEKRPGDLSPELVEALSIPPLAPPPWLISMQRFGPPPSYPTLRIPGLNAPIPEGAQWGFHPGGWGKPPLDEYNRPLYGDVFGVLPKVNDAGMGEPVDKTTWGELEPEEEEEEESEEDEDEDEDEQGDITMEGPGSIGGIGTGIQTPSGLETPSGMNSVVSTIGGGLETPDFLELRKNSNRSSGVEDLGLGQKSLYQVVPERQTSVRGIMGSERGYDVSGVSGSGITGAIPVLGDERSNKKRNGVDVSLDASELEGLSEEELKRKYEAHGRGNAGVPGSKEDFSDLVAKESVKRKLKEQRDSERKKEKFKF